MVVADLQGSVVPHQDCPWGYEVQQNCPLGSVVHHNHLQDFQGHRQDFWGFHKSRLDSWVQQNYPPCSLKDCSCHQGFPDSQSFQDSVAFQIHHVDCLVPCQHNCSLEHHQLNPDSQLQILSHYAAQCHPSWGLFPDHQLQTLDSQVKLEHPTPVDEIQSPASGLLEHRECQPNPFLDYPHKHSDSSQREQCQRNQCLPVHVHFRILVAADPGNRQTLQDSYLPSTLIHFPVCRVQPAVTMKSDQRYFTYAKCLCTIILFFFRMQLYSCYHGQSISQSSVRISFKSNLQGKTMTLE